MGKSSKGAKSAKKQKSVRKRWSSGKDSKRFGNRKSSAKEILGVGLVCFAAIFSRVENGHTVPSVETLQKLANAMGLKLYELFHEGGPVEWLRPNGSGQSVMPVGKEEQNFARALSKLDRRQRTILLAMAQKLAKKKTANA